MFRGHEAHSRSLAKAVTWRVSASLHTFRHRPGVHWKDHSSGINSSDGARHEDCPLLSPRTNLGSHFLGASSQGLAGPLRLIRKKRPNGWGPKKMDRPRHTQRIGERSASIV